MPQFCRDFGHFFQLAYRDFWSFYHEFLLTLMGTGNYSAISNNIKSWYTGRWWVSCYVWYSDEGTGRGPSPPRPLIAVPNVTATHQRSVPITVLLYNDPLPCGFNVPIKGLMIGLMFFILQS